MSFSRRAGLAFASLLSLAVPFVAGDASSYAENALCTTDQLMRWYDTDAGLWTYPDGAVYWWQAANMLSAVANICALSEDVNSLYSGTFETTYTNSPGSNIYDEEGWISDYLDDEGWWGLAWVDVFDTTGDTKYLDAASDIFEDIGQYWNFSSTGCGGLPWNKTETTGVLAIENEIYIQLAAMLANRVDSGNNSYLDTAVNAWEWFQGTGLINSDNLINDGLDETTCENNGAPTYSYNQGVIIGGLVELYDATDESSYLDAAEKIADAVTVSGGPLTTDDGILVDDCDRDHTCEGDGIQFKGVFTRNLRKLQLARGKQQWKSFLETNAQSIWNNDLSIDDSGACFVGNYWQGPADPVTFNASSQSSGLDCLNAALAVTQ